MHPSPYPTHQHPEPALHLLGGVWIAACPSRETHNGSGAYPGCLGDELSAVVLAPTWPTALLA
jgi:hypothetical protein